MPNVVVVGGIIECKHQGLVKFSSGDKRLEISGVQALTAGMEAGFAFSPGSPGLVAPCTWTDPKTGSPSYCSQTIKASSGISELMTVGGQGVLLDNASGEAVNASDLSATWSISMAGQTLVSVSK